MSEYSLERLVSGPPWVRFRALVDLAGVSADAPEARAALIDMLASPQVQALLADAAGWPGTVLASHRSAGQTFHSLGFLGELSAGADLEAVSPAAAAAVSSATARILARMDPDGVPTVPMTYPEHFGGPGVETWAWALCDAPIILRALVRFGLAGDERVRRGIRALVGLAEPAGWPCRVSPELGAFRGPGKKTDPCPFATLIMLELLAVLREEAPGDAELVALSDGPAAAAGIEALLSCWERSETWHPYIFYMGTDFRKLKAPGLWYDILHTADVLSRFPEARADPRFREMSDTLRSKRRPDGAFAPESVYQPYKAWDFGQKKEGSPWIELVASRIESRMGRG